jgi:glycosyltransferase involved in cell wall biosynthesis
MVTLQDRRAASPERAPRPQPDWDAIVVCSMPFGGDPPFADTHLARALAEHRRVLVVDLPSRRPGEWGLGRVGPNLWRLRPFAPPGCDRPVLASLADPALVAQVEVAARRVLGQRRSLVTFSAPRGALWGLRREVTVYWQRDVVANPHYTRSVGHVRRRHRSLARRADVVTAVSPAVVEELRALNPAARFLPNGADVAHFSRPAPDPGRAQLPPGPVVGYLGAVSWRVDLELVAEMAVRRPSWSFVLVGARSVTVPELPNLHATGAVPYQAIPGWAQRFDVGFVPYVDNHFNQGSFPLKVYEYLAAGVPVVSTPLRSLAGLHPHVRTAATPDGLLEACEAALREGPRPDECRDLAALNSWSARAEDLAALVDAVLDGRPQPSLHSP